MSCVFCGGFPVTKEHVFPQWLNQYLSPGRQQLEQARYGEGAYDKTRQGAGLDFTVKKVCAPCNNGWMSQIEYSARGALEPLLSRQDFTFVSLRQQRQIAQWATKTAMMADQTQREPVLPPHQLRKMHTHRTCAFTSSSRLRTSSSSTPVSSTSPSPESGLAAPASYRSLLPPSPGMGKPSRLSLTRFTRACTSTRPNKRPSTGSRNPEISRVHGEEWPFCTARTVSM